MTLLLHGTRCTGMYAKGTICPAVDATLLHRSNMSVDVTALLTVDGQPSRTAPH